VRPIQVVVRYVDGSQESGMAQHWRSMRSEGVDWIEVDHVRIHAQSLYWLRREGEHWRVGGASFYQQPSFEVEIGEEGQREVPVEWVPDLLHDDVKLGWWWPRGDYLASH
jgi:hypothetical protein